MEESLVIKGFQASGVSAGLKKNSKKDLGLLYSSHPSAVAGVFTRNLIQAAPVALDRERIKSGRCQAIVVNSGNANCCTGKQGMVDALTMAKSVADRLGLPEVDVLVASTGVIGEPLPIHRVEAAVPELVAALRTDGLPDLAQAIMTTDTVPKVVDGQGCINGRSFHLAAVAKGAGMIRPDMATMLCFVISDIGLNPKVMQQLLQSATDKSFNRITVDGDMSTNDTILFMANGASGVSATAPEQMRVVGTVLDDVLIQLARLCVKDGEGATKLVEVQVAGAVTDRDARNMADTVANSSLVKTALFGEDANWGRILAAAGRSGAHLDPNRIDIFFDSVQMVKNGVGCGKTVESEAGAVLRKPELTLRLDLKIGQGFASVLTCDFSLDYVRINADYRS